MPQIFQKQGTQPALVRFRLAYEVGAIHPVRLKALAIAVGYWRRSGAPRSPIGDKKPRRTHLRKAVLKVFQAFFEVCDLGILRGKEKLMTSRDLFDRIVRLPPPISGVPQVPPPELVAFTIRCGRGLRSWKKSTLADFAGLSLSTVERAERGEVVLPDSLDRMAEALGYGAGYFTAPRRPLSEAEIAASLSETYGELIPVQVAPLRTEKQVRALIRCHAYLAHCPDVTGAFEADIHGLIEWLDLAAFATSDFAGLPRERARRRLYADVLGFVRDMETRGLNVLAGEMDAPQAKFPDWKVAVLAVSLKAKDPGAVKRKHVFIDRRIVAFRDAA